MFSLMKRGFHFPRSSELSTRLTLSRCESSRTTLSVPCHSRMSSSTASKTQHETLSALFPPTKRGTTSYASTLHPGVSAQSGRVLSKLLQDDYERWHIYFNEEGFHNHATHHLYAIYALGADAALLKAAYATHTVYMKPAFDSPSDITESNWKDHMGDDKYYRAYLKFFSSAVLERGMSATIERYVFSAESNFEKGRVAKKQPQMVNRFISGVLHPLIHAGHALEFGSPGMLAEGLAMACTQQTDSDLLIPESLFSPAEGATAGRLGSTNLNALNLLARMYKDPQLDPSVARRRVSIPTQSESDDHMHYDVLKSDSAALLLEYVNQWDLDAKNSNNVKEKIEELSFLVTLIYGVAGTRPGKAFNADFVFMHLVTSSLFIPSYVDYLSPRSLDILLRSYLASIFGFWITRGRPRIDIGHFYESVTAHPVPPGPLPEPAKETILSSHDKDIALTPNPWHAILQSTLLHPNEHLPKIQRALAYYASLYGSIDAGKFADTELEGAEKLDGTIFVRVAGETAGRIGWMREGEERGDWDFGDF